MGINKKFYWSLVSFKWTIFLFPVIIFNLFPGASDGQDTLVKINGERIHGKIIEVADTYILYNPLPSADSINLMISTAEISSIRFFNGEKEMINDPKISGQKYKITFHNRQFFYQNVPPTRPALYKILKSQNDPEINMHVKNAKKLALMSTCFAWSGIPVFLIINYSTSISAQNSNDGSIVYNKRYFGYALFLIASGVIAVETTALILKIRHKKSMVKAVNRYNGNIFE